MQRQCCLHRGAKLITSCFMLFSGAGSICAAKTSAFCQTNNAVIVDEASPSSQTLVSVSVAESQKKEWENFLNPETLPEAAQDVESIVGSSIDIRPPVPLIRFISDLDLLEGDRLPVAEQAGKSIYIGFPTTFALTPTQIWDQVVHALQNKEIPLSHFEPKGEAKLYTSWKIWDEEFSHLSTQARYCVSLVHLKKKGPMPYLKISLLHQQPLYEPLQQQIVLENGKTLPLERGLTSAYQRERQLKLFANDILAEFEKIHREKKAEEFLKNCQTIEVQADLDVQLRPQFIIDAPFEFTWELMPHLLSKCYMTLTAERTKAEMSCAYLPPNKALTEQELQEGFWILDLLPDTYFLQFVDLGDKTSVQWCSAKNGAVLVESEEIFKDALVALFKDYKKYLMLETTLQALYEPSSDIEPSLDGEESVDI